MAKLRRLNYRNLGEGRVLRFKEKNGRDREIPVRHDPADCLSAYIKDAGMAEDSESKAPLFRAADGKRKILTPAPYMREMMKRRLNDAGLPTTRVYDRRRREVTRNIVGEWLRRGAPRAAGR